jgi:hypothetical protein
VAGFIEHIRAASGAEPEVLQRSAWTGAALSREQFREIAFTILNDERRVARPKDGTSPAPEASPTAEVIRFVRDDGAEQYRYDLRDLDNDNRTKPGAGR